MSILGTYYGALVLNEKRLVETNMKNRIKLEYYATEKPICVKEEYEIAYGISIIKKEYCKNRIKREKNSVEKISTNKRKIKDIIKMLKEYEVTPIALEDVLEDLLKQDKREVA